MKEFWEELSDKEITEGIAYFISEGYQRSVRFLEWKQNEDNKNNYAVRVFYHNDPDAHEYMIFISSRLTSYSGRLEEVTEEMCTEIRRAKFSFWPPF